MKELEIIIRPEKLEKLKSILDEFHCGGMTISSVMGCGTQRGNTEGETKVIKGRYCFLRPRQKWMTRWRGW